MTVTKLTDRLDSGQRHIDNASELIDSEELKSVFPDSLLARWLHCCRKLESAGYGASVLTAYYRFAPQIARVLDPQAAFNLADSVSEIAAKTGRIEAQLLPQASLIAANRLNDERGYRSWVSLIEGFAAIAPESTSTLLDRMDHLLTTLSVSRLESWILTGIRSTGGDAERRLKFFSFEDPESTRWLLYESGSVTFDTMTGRIRPYMKALWNISVPIREHPITATKNMRRRSSFSNGLIRLPTSFAGFIGEHAEDQYLAAAAHIGAHIRYSSPKFPVRKLKPIQIAVISLIEDARVENLAIRDFPGLRRLWLPLHVAQTPSSLSPNHALMAPNLLARLARALIDPDFSDFSGWIKKAKLEFFNLKAEWSNPEFSRELGGVLGNDLGQMRVGWQFDITNYVVEPPYRDDNVGLWEYPDQEVPPDAPESEQLFDSIRIEEQQEDDLTPPDRENSETEQNNAIEKPVKLEVQMAEGLPVASYPEYDYQTGRERPDWATVVEYIPPLEKNKNFDYRFERDSVTLQQIKSLIKAAKVSRPKRIKKQSEGEILDLDSCIDAAINQRMQISPDPRVYSKYVRHGRDLSVLLLLDISQSTSDKVSGSIESVLDLEIRASMLLAHAMSELGDPFAIAGFCSNNRDDVRYYRIKDFSNPLDEQIHARMASLDSNLSTRMGIAIRHAGTNLARQHTYRRLLLIITDGEPSDLDVNDPLYLIEDAKKAVQTLSNQSIDVFCVGLETAGQSYLEKIFGRRNYSLIDRVEQLPLKLPSLYLRMTA